MATTTTTSGGAANYADCVSSLRTSLEFLKSSVETLGNGVADFPRLITVTKAVRVCLEIQTLPFPFTPRAPTIHEKLTYATMPFSKYQQHYELIPQPTIAAAEASLRDEIGPYISLLLSRADAQVERQDRRIETLKARAELQQGRIARPSVSQTSSQKMKNLQQKQQRGISGGSRQLRGEDKLRARVVRQRKEALAYGIERLELEVLQKERELRKRLEAS